MTTRRTSKCLPASDIVYDAVQQEVDLSWPMLLAVFCMSGWHDFTRDQNLRAGRGSSRLQRPTETGTPPRRHSSIADFHTRENPRGGPSNHRCRFPSLQRFESNDLFVLGLGFLHLQLPELHSEGGSHHCSYLGCCPIVPPPPASCWHLSILKQPFHRPFKLLQQTGPPCPLSGTPTGMLWLVGAQAFAPRKKWGGELVDRVTRRSPGPAVLLTVSPSLETTSCSSCEALVEHWTRSHRRRAGSLETALGSFAEPVRKNPEHPLSYLLSAQTPPRAAVPALLSSEELPPGLPQAA